MRSYSRRSPGAKGKSTSICKSRALDVAQVDGVRDKSSEALEDEVSYKRNTERIQKLLKSKNPDRRQIKTLMELTYPLRRQWIQTEAKSVKEIMEKFPCLKSKQHVSV